MSTKKKIMAKIKNAFIQKKLKKISNLIIFIFHKKKNEKLRRRHY